MLKEIKKIKAISLAKVLAMFYGIIGFFTAVFTLLFSATGAVSEKFDFGLIGFIVFNIVIIIIFGIIISLLTAFFGWALGFLIAFFYNLFASRLGGIKIELEDDLKKDFKDNTNEIKSFK